MTVQLTLSQNAKKALIRGVAVSIVTAFVYLLIVVVTTPSLPPITAITIALTVNTIVILGTAVGIGTQSFIFSYGRGLGCLLSKKKRAIGAGSGGTVFSSFLSFFSLVPLGCCGSWLFILSFLPSIFGSSLSVVLIQYSTPLSYLGLGIVLGFAGLQALRLRRELAVRRKLGQETARKEDSTSYGQ
ncbi:MAG: hypothetical protein ACREBU_07155 [Nitrososphaera sp.]